MTTLAFNFSDLLFPEFLEDPLMRIFLLGRVGVHTRDAGAWEEPGDLTFNLLGPESRETKDRRFAFPTGVGDFFLVIAIMA